MQPTNARWFQLFRLENGKLVNEKGKVMDVQGGHDRNNANIQVHKDLGPKRLNQLFDIVYVDEMPKEPKKGELNKDFGIYVQRPFHVISGLKEERYMDTFGGNKMVIKTPNGRKSQLWYFDQRTKTIKSSSRGYSWNINGNGKADRMDLYRTNSAWWQIFFYDEASKSFRNGKDKRCVDAKKDEEGASLNVLACNGSAGQKWTILYEDKAEKSRTKGMNTDFGFEINRPFFVVSQMPMKRVLTCHGAS
jgi:hypothetical protein